MPGEVIRSYLERLHGDRQGWVFVAHSTPSIAGGKVQHPDFTETPFAIPRQTGQLVAHLEQMSETCDTWITPGLSANPVRNMRRRKSLPSRWLWCDLDGAGVDDQARALELAANGGFCVSSGRGPDHLHVYVRLAVAVDANRLQTLNRRLVAYLHADASPSAINGYLRPPGTWNHKAAALGDGPAARVTFHGHGDGDGAGWQLATLEARLPPDRSRTSSRPGASFAAGDIAPESLPELLPPAVAVLLHDPLDAGVDRSSRLYTLAVACQAAGFTPGQTVSAARAHRPSIAKYGRRLDTEVARILGKLQEQR